MNLEEKAGEVLFGLKNEALIPSTEPGLLL